MKKNKIIVAALVMAVFISGILLNACVKQNYSTPPDLSTYDPPHNPVNMTLATLSRRAQALQSGQSVLLGDSTIYGIVTADDRSGNFYHQIVIQDSSGAGMTIDIQATYLYNSYPIGRKIYMNLKGLYLASYASLPQICGGLDNTGKVINIPSAIASGAITAASYPNTVIPSEQRLSNLLLNPTKYYNLLVQIDSVEFDSTSANQSYAGSISSGTATNRYIYDCQNLLTLYNSNYATFQPAVMPAGYGTIKGIFSVYNSAQFLIRDTSDVRMNSPRKCK